MACPQLRSCRLRSTSRWRCGPAPCLGWRFQAVRPAPHGLVGRAAKACKPGGCESAGRRSGQRHEPSTAPGSDVPARGGASTARGVGGFCRGFGAVRADVSPRIAVRACVQASGRGGVVRRSVAVRASGALLSAMETPTGVPHEPVWRGCLAGRVRARLPRPDKIRAAVRGMPTLDVRCAGIAGLRKRAAFSLWSALRRSSRARACVRGVRLSARACGWKERLRDPAPARKSCAAGPGLAPLLSLSRLHRASAERRAGFGSRACVGWCGCGGAQKTARGALAFAHGSKFAPWGVAALLFRAGWRGASCRSPGGGLFRRSRSGRSGNVCGGGQVCQQAGFGRSRKSWFVGAGARCRGI